MPLQMEAHLGVEGVGEAGHAAADAGVGLRVRVVGGQQERREPAGLAAVAVPCADGDQVQRVPQPFAVVPVTQRQVRVSSSLRCRHSHFLRKLRIHRAQACSQQASVSSREVHVVTILQTAYPDELCAA